MNRFVFPVGYHAFHRNQLFNFQLNRWHSLGYMRKEDMAQAGRRIRNFGDWKREMLLLAAEAKSEGRVLNEAFAYRAAEFYTKSVDPDKEDLYGRFIETFSRAVQGEPIERLLVEYEGGFLPVMKLNAEAKGGRGTILFHGGFDSLLEEWYSVLRFFAERGFTIIGFEGPGQGWALRKAGLPLTYEWEKPVKAVLDHFRPFRPTLIGMSMGGWLALRAAAFDPRIERVITSGHAIDYMRCMNAVARGIHLWFMEHCRGFMDRMAALKFENRDNMASWVVDHFKYITKEEKPLDALEIYLQMNERNMHPERIRQDVLVLTGREDHFIPFRMHARQIQALINARSVTGRVFSREEHAQNHCQTGNIGLALDVMARWIESLQ